ncbi:MAG: hypothetical protein BRC26_01260, partial [Nanohaloarchaea archaeon QH_8_44_6]
KESDLLKKNIGQLRDMEGFPKEFKITSIIKPEETLEAESKVELDQSDELILIGPQESKEKLDAFFQDQ